MSPRQRRPEHIRSDGHGIAGGGRVAARACMCGCGTALKKRTSQLAPGHYQRAFKRSGPDSPNWKGGRAMSGSGYILVAAPDNPRADYRGYVPEHVLMVERATGRPLRASAPVHHVDGNRLNNANGNLVACNDVQYHNLLEARTRALRLCGNANWRPCVICKRYEDVANMKLRTRADRPTWTVYYHAACHAQAERSRRERARRVA